MQSILVAIARCLTDERLENLRDRLIFVEWSDGARPEMTSTVVNAEGFVIPVQRLVVPDYLDVFEVLNDLERTIPARLLRHLRKEVYELVRTNEPGPRLFVEELAADVDLSDVQVYAGIGAITKVTTSYVGLDRGDLLEDLLVDRAYDPTRVVLEALPGMGSRTTLIPVYKYLRAANYLSAGGGLRDRAELPPRVVARVDARETLLKGLKQYEKRAERLPDGTTLEDLVVSEKADDVIYLLPFLDRDLVEPAVLEAFLITNRESFDSNRQPAASQWGRAVCLYDWLRYGAR